MRIQSVGAYNGYVPNRNLVQNINNRQDTKVMQNPNFGNIAGKLIGGSFGAAAGLSALLLFVSGPVGWLGLGAAAVLGASAGSKIGNEATGPDDPKSSGQTSGQ